MQVKLNPKLLINKINPIKIFSRPNIILNKLGDKIYFNKKLVSAGVALTLLTNWFSKEDLIKVSELENNYSTLGKKELINIKDEVLKSYLKKFNSIGLTSTVQDNKTQYNFDTTLVDKETRNSLKKDFLQLFALNNCISKNTIARNKVPLSYWFDTAFGIQKSKENNNRLEHPEDKSIRAFGGYLKDDLEQIKSLHKTFLKWNNNRIIREKLKILDKIVNLHNGHKIYFEGSFTNKELDNIKELAIKYRALNDVQKSRGLFTKNIETLLYAQPIPENIKKGDYAEGIGYVVNRIKMDNEDFIITFSEINKTYTFSLYKLNELNNTTNILENIPKTLSIEDVNDLNKQAKSVIDSEKEIIAQIGFQVKSDGYKNLKHSNNYNDKNLKQILDNNTDYIYISDFSNNYPHKYCKAGKIIGIQLLKFLKERNCFPLFLTADTYKGSKHSPVSMYLRAGFKPISYSVEELKNKMSTNKSRFPENKKVDFYLDNFDGNGDIIDSLAKIYELT